MRERRRKAAWDIVFVLAFFSLLTLQLMLIGFTPTAMEAAQLISGLAVVCLAILVHAERKDRNRHSAH